MSRLSENWLTENIIDFEYKKYVLLGYLQQVKEQFKEQKLYPDLSDLISHYKNLIELKQNTSSLENSFKKNLKGIDFNTQQFLYESTINDESLNELKQIIEFSEPLLANELHHGKAIFEFAEQHISVSNIGLIPIYKAEGYFLLQGFKEKQVEVYQYCLTKIKLIEKQVLGLQCDYLKSLKLTLSTQVDKIKLDLISENPQLPNPAVYFFKTDVKLPTDETFLPIAKRLLYQKLAA